MQQESEITLVRWIKNAAQWIFPRRHLTREIKQLRHSLFRMEWDRNNWKADCEFYKESFIENLKQLKKRDNLIHNLRVKLSEASKSERQRKINLP
jgi:hypothetical protein